MKFKVLKYDKNKAKVFFVLFKLLELFGIFLFFFGFNWFGNLIIRYFPEVVTNLFFNEIPSSYIGVWAVGLLSFFSLIIILVISGFIIFGIIKLLIYWIKGNWKMAIIVSEDKNSKLERLNEEKKLKEIKRIEKLEEQRREYGVCEGDKLIEYKTKKIFEVTGFDDENENYPIWLKDDNGEYDLFRIDKKDKIIKKKIPKKPKLSKIRKLELKKSERRVI